MSALEQTVLDVERWLSSPETKRARPETGEDVKVMGTRLERDVQLTIACAFVSSNVRDAQDYLDKKASLARALGDFATRDGRRPEVTVNAADDPGSESFYLTVTGTSAESGDDGQVGRGNRVSGLITPGRAMTLEAAAGKNPVSHVGKLYNVAAGFIARKLVWQLPNVTDAECALVSRIGAPIDEPQIVSLRLGSPDREPSSRDKATAAEIVRTVLARLPALSRQLIAGDVAVY